MTDSSQYVTLPIVRELLETQERTFRTMVQMFFESVRSEARDIRKEVNDLKESLTFSQKDIEEAKVNIKNIESKVTKITGDIDEAYKDIEDLYDSHEYLENHSRRSNIKVFGIPEKAEIEGPELFEECENAVKDQICAKLNIKKEECQCMMIEWAHQVGKQHAPFHHLANGTKVKSHPRPIVVKFLNWKDKEKVLRAARLLKPNDVQFLEDFSKRTLDKRKAKIQELIAARKSGKRVFLVMDRIVYGKPPPT